MTLSPATLTLLEKAAIDNGFDWELPREDDWLGFDSTHAPLEIWLTVDAIGHPLAALSRLDVARALGELGTTSDASPPPGATVVLAVPDIAALSRLLRRAYQLARSLPDGILHEFEKQTAGLPRATEAERLVVQRVGQGLFRAGLMDYWEGRCAITGLAVPELLRASHIKPWSACDTDAERLDVFNGFLLAPHLDAVFDAGLITLGEQGEVVTSPMLPVEAQKLLGLDAPLRVTRLEEKHRIYLAHHRQVVFQTRS